MVDTREFSIPHKREKKKEKEKEKEKEKVCKHFLLARCRHGFRGKNAVDGKNTCPFLHPNTCKKYLDHGIAAGGCLKGKTCEFVHPTICRSSLTSRLCPNIKGGGKM
jgi:hypothetical protein